MLLGGDAVGLLVFPSAGRAFAVADAALDICYFLLGKLAVAGDEMLAPEGEVLGQFARVVEVEAYGTKGVYFAIDGDMAAATDGVGLGLRLGKADIEEGEQYVGAIADVVSGTLPLQHRLMQYAGGVEVGIEVVAVVYEAVVSLVLLGFAFDGIVEQVFIAFAHIEGGGGVFRCSSMDLAVEILMPLTP